MVVNQRVVVAPAVWRVVREDGCLRWYKPGALPGQWLYVNSLCFGATKRLIITTCSSPEVQSIQVRVTDGNLGIRCINSNGVRSDVVTLPAAPQVIRIFVRAAVQEPSRICIQERTIEVRYQRQGTTPPSTQQEDGPRILAWVNEPFGFKYNLEGEENSLRLVKKQRFRTVRRLVGPLRADQYVQSVRAFVVIRHFGNGQTFALAYKTTSRKGEYIRRKFADKINECFVPRKKRTLPGALSKTKRFELRRERDVIIASWLENSVRGFIRVPAESDLGRSLQRTFGFLRDPRVVTFFGNLVLVRSTGETSSVIRTLRRDDSTMQLVRRLAHRPARYVDRRIKFSLLNNFYTLQRKSERLSRWVVFRRVPQIKLPFLAGLRSGSIQLRRGRLHIQGVNLSGGSLRKKVRVNLASNFLRRISRWSLSYRRRRNTIVVVHTDKFFIVSHYDNQGKSSVYTISKKPTSLLTRYLLSYWKLKDATKIVIKRHSSYGLVKRYAGSRRIGRFLPSIKNILSLVTVSYTHLTLPTIYSV
eukprot:TRINITY_DN11564_c0_g1_i3.p1 TRINITY_DN11564_c0_g1~~TRINITY_DN11564_c0_g1_i3.p1  ORF type:complete len:530 (-),score=94.19 TRINITY_DN11564_c0_g1_i3:37-1626(-)